MKQRILFIDDKPGYGGISTCLISLANELCKIEYEVLMIVARKSVYETRVNAMVKIEECNFENEKEVEYMIDSLDDRGVHIVNSHADWRIQIQLLRKRKSNYQLYITEHMAIFDDQKYMELREEYFSLANNAEKVITVSLAGRRAFQKAGVEDRKIVTIYNGVQERPYRVRSYQKIRLMYVGRLTETKGIFTLLQAIEEVCRWIPDVQVDIYGTGRQEAEVRQYINEKHLEKNCILKGFCESMDGAYQEHEIVLVPSKTESCSFTILEAMNESCAVLASDVDGTREIVYHKVTGLLHPFGNYKKLAEQINELLENPLQIRMLAENAHYQVTHSFRQEDSVRDYIKCLKNC